MRDPPLKGTQHMSIALRMSRVSRAGQPTVVGVRNKE